MSELFTKTIADADLYFSPDNHSRAADWSDHTPAARSGAFAQARRELEAFTGRDMQDPLDDDAGSALDTMTDSGIYGSRDDFAVYEQALEILDRQPRRETGSSAKRLGKPKESETQGFRISPIALTYLRTNRIKMVRG